VYATRNVVAENITAITTAFYKRLFKNHPELYQYFNKTNQANNKQANSLAEAVVAYAMNIGHLENLHQDVDRITNKHCALNVPAEGYQIVHDNLLSAVEEVCGEAITPEIGIYI